MFGAWPEASHQPCPECGASLSRAASGEHACDAERRIDFLFFQLRGEIGAFDEQFTAWLSTAAGRFATWIAERDRLRASEA